ILSNQPLLPNLSDNEVMTIEVEIRESLPTDIPSIEKLYPDAFPDEDLLPLVTELLNEEPIVLSLVGIVDQTLVGHVIFTLCSIAGRSDEVALLGPLAVTPAWQKKGIGGSLVCEGLERMKSNGIAQIYVLGDPAYYRIFGFDAVDAVKSPYPLPKEWHGAWQSISLGGTGPSLHGKLSVPQPWLQPALWWAP
ncbi:MAG: GNAT family N-acetyltransferase, partial [Desulfobulbia bacterium]